MPAYKYAGGKRAGTASTGRHPVRPWTPPAESPRTGAPVPVKGKTEPDPVKREAVRTKAASDRAAARAKQQQVWKQRERELKDMKAGATSRTDDGDDDAAKRNTRAAAIQARYRGNKARRSSPIPWERGAAGLTAKTASATAADTTREKLAARERLKVTWPEKRDEEAVTRGTARAAQYVACLAAGMADAPPPLDEFRLKYDEEAALARLPDIAAAEAKKKEEMVAAELAAAAQREIIAKADAEIRVAKADAARPAGLTPFEAKLWRAFHRADADGSGAISAEELAAALEACGLHGTAAEYATLFKSADKDHNGRVEWEEFKKLGKKKVGAHRRPARPQPRAAHTPR